MCGTGWCISYNTTVISTHLLKKLALARFTALLPHNRLNSHPSVQCPLSIQTLVCFKMNVSFVICLQHRKASLDNECCEVDVHLWSEMFFSAFCRQRCKWELLPRPNSTGNTYFPFYFCKNFDSPESQFQKSFLWFDVSIKSFSRWRQTIVRENLKLPSDNH